MKNEQTSKKVAAIAGRVLRKLDRALKPYGLDDSGGVFISIPAAVCAVELCTIKEIKSVLASALTQAPDKPKKKP